jgi:shikimate kinase
MPRSEREALAEGSRCGIALTGFMGAGKTTVGRQLALAVNLPFVDLDHAIERASGHSVSALFARTGEEGFRRWEASALASICSGAPVVLALGGGTLHQPENAKVVEGRMRVFVLDVPWGVIMPRIRDGVGRPLADHAASLYAERRAGYLAAGVVVSGDQPVGSVVEDILAHWRAA